MATTNKANMLPYSERVKIVRFRLATARRADLFVDLPKPAKVLAAEKCVAEWEARNDKARDAHYDKHRAKVREIENALLLGDGEKVAKLLSAIGA